MRDAWIIIIRPGLSDWHLLQLETSLSGWGICHQAGSKVARRTLSETLRSCFQRTESSWSA